MIEDMNEVSAALKRMMALAAVVYLFLTWQGPI